MTARAIGVLTLTTTILTAGPLLAGNGVVVEDVSIYSANDSLPNENPNGTGFYNTITSSGLFSKRNHWQDNSVWDSDFLDPQLTGLPSSNDTNNFDQSGVAISYFSGHGVCNSGQANQPCANSSACTNPPPGLRSGGTCVFVSSQTTGACHYPAPRYLVTNSTNNAGGAGYGFVNYNNFTVNQIAWGESTNAGPWRAAGTNGGTNVVVTDVSCGTYVSSLLPDLAPQNAGIHMMASVMPTGGDKASVSDRGPTFANAMIINPNSSVASSWLNLVSTLSAGDGAACQVGGGGRGINGCGGYAVVTVGATSTEAVSHMNETWIDVQNDAKDSTGVAWWSYRYSLNYDGVRNPPLH